MGWMPKTPHVGVSFPECLPLLVEIWRLKPPPKPPRQALVLWLLVHGLRLNNWHLEVLGLPTGRNGMASIAWRLRALKGLDVRNLSNGGIGDYWLPLTPRNLVIVGPYLRLCGFASNPAQGVLDLPAPQPVEFPPRGRVKRLKVVPRG